MFLWYIEFAAKDRQHEHGIPDSTDWQAKLIADVTTAALELPAVEPEKAKPTPPLKRAG